MFTASHKTFSSGRIELYAAAGGGDNASKREQYRKILAGAIKTQLPPKLAETVSLYYFKELTIYQVANELGVHPSTVSRRLSAAVEQIKRFAEGCVYCLPKNDDEA